jgi:FAD/FMN-containing dehydrogenase
MAISTPSPAQVHAARRELQQQIGGEVIGEADADYSAVRKVWNAAVDRRPALIARCHDESDVVAAVLAARSHGLALSVRGGGHDWAGRALCVGGLTIDLSAMRGVTVDGDRRTAIVQGGVHAGDVVSAARSHASVPVTGTVTSVGIVGLMLAGGYGPLCGKHGLAADNLVSAELVLADGRRVTASENTHPDLYWALQGGGGNFGVVTAIRYRLHPLVSVTTGLLAFPIAQAEQVLDGYEQEIAVAPDELTLAAGFLTAPDGQPIVFLFPTWCGEEREGAELVARLRALGDPVMARVGVMAYEDALGMFDAQVVGGRSWLMRTRSLSELTDEVTTVLVDAARTMTSPMSAIVAHHFHGAAARVPVTATAFATRRDHRMLEILAGWEATPSDDGANHMRWANDLSEKLASASLPGGYPNLLGPDEDQRVRLAYGPNADRLRELKLRYDPEGVFAAAIGTFTSAPVPHASARSDNDGSTHPIAI